MKHTAHSLAVIGVHGEEGGGGIQLARKMDCLQVKVYVQVWSKVVLCTGRSQKEEWTFLEFELAGMGVWIDFMFNIPIKTEPNGCKEKNLWFFVSQYNEGAANIVHMFNCYAKRMYA